MELSSHELRICLDIAEQFSQQYANYTKTAAVPEDEWVDLLACGRVFIGNEIEIFELDEAGEHETIYGFYVSEEENGYSILLKTGIGPDLTKSVICKELFHIFIDSRDPAYRNSDPADHLDQIIATFFLMNARPGAAVRSELLAEVAAMEFLFPYDERKKVMAATPVNFEEIAQRYRIPQYLIERYLHPSNMEELGAMAK